MDNCPECGKWTREGAAKLAEHHRDHPIYGINLQRPMSEIIAEIRMSLTQARGTISDFQFAFPQWKDRTTPVEGLLTCGIVALYDVIKELEKFEQDCVAMAEKEKAS